MGRGHLGIAPTTFDVRDVDILVADDRRSTKPQVASPTAGKEEGGIVAIDVPLHLHLRSLEDDAVKRCPVVGETQRGSHVSRVGDWPADQVFSVAAAKSRALFSDSLIGSRCDHCSGQGLTIENTDTEGVPRTWLMPSE